MQTGSLKKKKRVEKQAAVPPTPERSMFPLQSVNQSVSQSISHTLIYVTETIKHTDMDVNDNEMITHTAENQCSN